MNEVNDKMLEHLESDCWSRVNTLLDLLSSAQRFLEIEIARCRKEKDDYLLDRQRFDDLFLAISRCATALGLAHQLRFFARAYRSQQH